MDTLTPADPCVQDAVQDALLQTDGLALPTFLLALPACEDCVMQARIRTVGGKLYLFFIDEETDGRFGFYVARWRPLDGTWDTIGSALLGPRVVKDRAAAQIWFNDTIANWKE